MLETFRKLDFLFISYLLVGAVLVTGCLGGSDEPDKRAAMGIVGPSRDLTMRQDFPFSEKVTSGSVEGLSLSLLNAPEGITIDSSGVVSGSPVQTGSFKMKVLARNGDSLDSKTFNFCPIIVFVCAQDGLQYQVQK